MKNTDAFIEIRDALSARNINIWSLDEKIGSRSHPDKFLEKSNRNPNPNQNNQP
jgi:hypothetical protein